MSQTDAVLALLRERGQAGVTPLDALDELGCFRLGARVWDLNKEGHIVVNRWKTLPNGKRVACYVLAVEDLQLTLDGDEELIARVLA